MTEQMALMASARARELLRLAREQRQPAPTPAQRALVPVQADRRPPRAASPAPKRQKVAPPEPIRPEPSQMEALARRLMMDAKAQAAAATARAAARPPAAAAAAPVSEAAASAAFLGAPATPRRATFSVPKSASDDEIKHLLELDIEDAVSTATPATTKRTYDTYQRQYYEFCTANNLTDPTGANMKLYIAAFILSRSKGPKALALSTLKGPVRAALGALVPLRDDRPTATQPVRRALYAAEHTAPYRNAAKAPLPGEWLVKIARACWNARSSIGTRDGAMFVFMALGLLRRSEAVALRKRDVRERTIKLADGSTQRCVEITVVKAKNDQQKKGHIRLLPAATLRDSPVCPIGALLRLNTITSGHGEESPLFFNLTDEKQKRSAYHVRAPPLPLAAATPNRRLKHWLSRCGADDDLLKRTGSHSLRKAGATAAWAAHVPRLTIQRAGAWRSNAVDAYIAVSEAEHAVCWKEVIDSIDDISDDDSE